MKDVICHKTHFNFNWFYAHHTRSIKHIKLFLQPISSYEHLILYILNFLFI